MSALEAQHYYTPEEYLALERKADSKSEYFDGGIYAMAGGSPTHSHIAFNIGTAVGPQLRGTSCRGYTSDLKVRSEYKGLFTYPDVTIVCGEPQYHDEQNDVLINPKVIFEVLSPSTERFDRGKKFAEFKKLKAFTDYVLIAQDEPQVDYFIKQPSGDWLNKSVSGLAAEIYIASLDCTLKLADIYDSVTFPLRLQIRDENETEE